MRGNQNMDPKTEKPLFARFSLPLSLVAAHALLVALVIAGLFTCTEFEGHGS